MKFTLSCIDQYGMLVHRQTCHHYPEWNVLSELGRDFPKTVRIVVDVLI